MIIYERATIWDERRQPDLLFRLSVGRDAVIWSTEVRLSPPAWLGSGHGFQLHVVGPPFPAGRTIGFHLITK